MIYASIFGQLNPPSGYGKLFGTQAGPATHGGLVALINNLLGIMTTAAGIFAVFNLISAGYMYLSANGQPQAITNAGNKIIQTAVGVGVVALAYVIAAIFGQILFNDPAILTKPKLFSLY